MVAAASLLLLSPSSELGLGEEASPESCPSEYQPGYTGDGLALLGLLLTRLWTISYLGEYRSEGGDGDPSGTSGGGAVGVWVG